MQIFTIKRLSAFFVMNEACSEIHFQEFTNKECRSAMLSDTYWLWLVACPSQASDQLSSQELSDCAGDIMAPCN